MNSFLTLAGKGAQSWWRYLLSFLTIFFFWFVLGSIPYVVQTVMHTTSLEWNFVNTMLSFLFLLLGLVLSVRLIHKRNFTTLITTQSRINWRKYMYGFSMTLGLGLLFTGIDFLIHPKAYRFVLTDWSIQDFALIFLLGLLFIPLQSAAEELLIRGYLLQELGTRLKNPYILAILTSIPFALLHSANPEVSKGALPMMLFYFFFGFVLALITIRSNGLELAMGIHAANNIFALLIVNQADSVLQSRPILYQDTWDPWTSLFTAIPFFLLLYFFISRSIARDAEKQV